MRFYTKEEQEKAIHKMIEEYRAAAALCVAIKPIIARYDGKVYNCKLSKELANIGRIFCKKDERTISIYVYDSFSAWHTLCLVQIEKALTGNKRIKSDVFLESCNSYREKHLQDAYSLEKHLPYVDMYKEQLQTLKAQIDHIRDGIPYQLRDVFGLDIRMR